MTSETESSETQTDTTREALGALFELHRVLNHAPRLAWGVVRDGELAMADGTEANEHTVFRIASMTKSFTAAAVLRLRDDGVFALDDPITRYAPELASIQKPTADSPPISIRHLLTMNSGLATDDPWADRHLDFSDTELDAEIATGATFAVPTGTAMQYSNLGYALLGRVVLRATGQRLQDIVNERLLQPLAMDSTFWSAQAVPDGRDVAIGQERIDGAYREIAMLDDGAIAPMGGLFTTVADLAKWVAFLADAFPARDGVDDGVLSRPSRREMQQSSTVFPPDHRSTLDGQWRSVTGGYGMGLMALHHEQLGTVVTHSGGVPGFGSNMRWVAGTSVGVIALANITYARMADAGHAALELLRATGFVERPVVEPSGELLAIAADLVALLNVWNGAQAAIVFADNVGQDESLDRRAKAAAAMVAAHGPLELVRVEAISHAEADGIVVGTHTNQQFRVEFQLSSQRPLRVQWYEIHPA